MLGGYKIIIPSRRILVYLIYKGKIMLIHCYKEALRLIRRSWKETAVLVAASAASEAVFILICLALGISYDFQTAYDALKAHRQSALLAMLPGVFIMAWFEAGLAGRIAMDALSGAPESMVHYAKGWFLRNLFASFLVSGGFLLLLVLFSAVPKVGMGLMLGWTCFAVWLMLRIALWQAAMFIEDLPPVEAMRRSYSLTPGSALLMGLIIIVPYFAMSLLLKLAAMGPLPGMLSQNLAQSVLEGLVTAFTMGAFTAAFLRQRAPAAAEAAPAPAAEPV